MLKTEKRNCKNCNQIFEAPIAEIKRGGGKFCNRKCAGEYKSKNSPNQKPNCKCALCGKQIYKTKSEQLKSKSGLFFCCIEHKNAAQKLDGGIKEIFPAHYGKAKQSEPEVYKKIALRHHEYCCNKCGYNKYPILEVHHKDKNRENSDPENLELLCPTCHEELHYLEKTRKYKATGKTKINWPSINTLTDLLKNNSYAEISRQLGISSNAIRKHIKKNNINESL